MSKPIDQLVEDLSLLLMDKGIVLAGAESCTGGLIATAITERAGSSQIFDRGYITYSNKAKQDMLGVSKNIIDCYGAVSKQCARIMAVMALKQSNADITFSVTGIAGPDGGSDEKPVGLVYFGIASKTQAAETFECHFEGSRHIIRQQSAVFVLEALIDYVGGN